MRHELIRLGTGTKEGWDLGAGVSFQWLSFTAWDRGDDHPPGWGSAEHGPQGTSLFLPDSTCRRTLWEGGTLWDTGQGCPPRHGQGDVR